MKFLYFLLFSLLICVGCTKVTPTKPNIDNTVITKQIKKEFFKTLNLDQRTTYFNIKLDGTTFKGATNNQNLRKSFSQFLADKGSKYKSEVALEKPRQAYINNSVANVRSSPKHSAELSTQYLLGQIVKVFNSTENMEWHYIQGPDNYLGWIDHGGIIFSANREYVRAPKVSLQENEVTAMQYENNTQVCCDLVFGNILGKVDDNLYITPDGIKVELQDSLFLEPSTENKVALAIEKAKSLMGRPYLWGGTSVKAMDCSGFTRMAYMNANYLLGRDASLQIKEGREIDKNNMKQWQSGDLLFFGNYREDGSERISHVAIHLENGRFIHASQKVKKESLNPLHKDFNKRRANTLMHVRRIFE